VKIAVLTSRYLRKFGSSLVIVLAFAFCWPAQAILITDDNGGTPDAKHRAALGIISWQTWLAPVNSENQPVVPIGNSWVYRQSKTPVRVFTDLTEFISWSTDGLFGDPFLTPATQKILPNELSNLAKL